MARDRTGQQHESIRHDEAHTHPVPVPHLKAEWGGHGPTEPHPHVHIRGGGHTYDHHPPSGPSGDGAGHDHITVAPDDLKSDHDHTDTNSP